LQVPGAADYAVEIYSMTKSYNMAGWRVGFCLGNRKLIAALARIKSYLDYGIFQPLQIAAVTGLRECDDAPGKIREVYQARRDVLMEGLRAAGWNVEPPKASMFTWARIPEPFEKMGSLEFTKLLMQETHLALSPGIGFGPMGEGFVRFSLIEEDDRVRQALAQVGEFFKKHGVTSAAKPEPVHV
jgi:alanine-synthesizing transaminase